MENSLISIIIPTYNRAHLIEETLDSVINQIYTNWECIVIDDGSTDDTENLLGKYCQKDSRIKFYKRPLERQPGGNAARNFGFEVSNGDFINWFDSDDIMKPNFLSAKLQIFKFNTELDAVCAYGAYFENDKSFVEIRKPKTNGSKPILDYVTSKLYFITHGPLWKRTFLNSKAYLYDEKRLKLQDTEFHFRMLIDGLKFAFYETDFLFLIRRGDERISSKKNLTIKKLESVLDYHYFTLTNYNKIPSSCAGKYKLITARKTLQSFYEAEVYINKIQDRVKFAISHRSKLKEAISILSPNIFKLMKLYLTILVVITYKKGFSFIK